MELRVPNMTCAFTGHCSLRVGLRSPKPSCSVPLWGFGRAEVLLKGGCLGQDSCLKLLLAHIWQVLILASRQGQAQVTGTSRPRWHLLRAALWAAELGLLHPVLQTFYLCAESCVRRRQISFSSNLVTGYYHS